jgi:hypothetical protein
MSIKMPDPTETLPRLPTDRVRELADVTRNGPLVVALAQEVLEWRKLGELMADGFIGETAGSNDT